MAFFKTVKQLLRELDGNPRLYDFASSLLDEVTEITKSAKKKSQYSNETQESLKQFQAKLNDALLAFDKSRNLAGFQVFAEACHNALYDHQPKLMAAPGIWNQLKALINNFLERYFNIEPCLGTDKSELALKDNFREAFNNTKNELSRLISVAEEDKGSSCFIC